MPISLAASTSSVPFGTFTSLAVDGQRDQHRLGGGVRRSSFTTAPGNGQRLA